MGFDIITRLTPENEIGDRKDIDCLLLVDYIKSIYTSNLDIMIIASDDSDYAPAIREAKRMGITCIAIVSSHSKAKIIANTSTIYLTNLFIQKDKGSRNDEKEGMPENEKGEDIVEN